MALTSPALTLAIEALFGHIRPSLDLVTELGPTDFAADAPGIDVRPGATIKVPLSTVSAALAYNDSTNNYLTGGNTDWASLTATHYLQGYDLSGTNIDQGVNASRVRQLFSNRCGVGIAMAVKSAVKTALNGTTTSTAVKIPAAGTATLAHYDGLATAVDWFDPTESCLVLNGTEFSAIKALMHAAHLSATPASIAEELGFRKVIVVAGMTARACIVPWSSVGFIARVPALVAQYAQAGTETDEKSGLSLGIVVADDQTHNRLVVNGDLWFGVAVCSASADASTTKGVINVGTAS